MRRRLPSTLIAAGALWAEPWSPQAAAAETGYVDFPMCSRR